MNTDERIQVKFPMRKMHLPFYPRRGKRDELAELFGEMNFNIGAEIGTQRGYFARTLCSKNPNLNLICIDPWKAYNGVSQSKQDDYYAQAMANLQGYKITFIKKWSIDALSDVKDGSLDFVYIDGNHVFDHAIMDIICWSAKVKKEGIIAVHDYHTQGCMGVVQAVEAYTRCHFINPWYVTREELPTAFWVKK